MKRILIIFILIIVYFNPEPFIFCQIIKREPVYFHISHHQEAVGHPSMGFPMYERFKENLLDELALLDRYDALSDQCFNDFIVSVILYMRDTGRDPDAEEIFSAFNQSGQNLGYHWHPATWEVPIRTDKVKDMELDSAIIEYEKWEAAYYDWSDFVAPDVDSSEATGWLDPGRLGGIQLMQQYFTKPLVNECMTLLHPAAAPLFRKKWPLAVGQAGNPHTYYATGSQRLLWMSDWGFSTESGIYVFKMMGLTIIRTRSESWIERIFPVDVLEQTLSNLPRDIPHLFVIHNTIPQPGHDPLEDHLEYLTKEFIPDNPGSRFISTADIPSLILNNPLQFSMEDLDEACLDLLYEWHGRPAAYVHHGNDYMSLASLFKGLQAAMQNYLSQPEGSRTWPQAVRVDDFIMPPVGRWNALPNDSRLYNGFPVSAMAAAVQDLTVENKIPYVVSIQVPGEGPSSPLQANAAEFLHGMCTLFLRLRQGSAAEQMFIMPSDIIPISNINGESSTGYDRASNSHMDWLYELELWTLEPVQLKGSDQSTVADEPQSILPQDYELKQNYPNPFNPSTSIQFKIPGGRVSIIIYDLLGRKVRNLIDEIMPSGWHEISWDGRNNSGMMVANDVYFYRMVIDQFREVKKAILIK